MTKKFGRALAALGASLALALTSCSGTANKPAAETTGASESAAAQAESSPIRMGAMFAPTDTFDPNVATTPGSMLLLFYLYDSLAYVTEDGAQLSLAKSIEPNADATEWTITLRDNLAFFDGTAVTGQDVIDSLKHLSESQNFAAMYGVVDYGASTATENTATLKLKAPKSDFLESSLGMMSPIAPKGKFDGVGAGTYKVTEGDSSTGYTMAANEKYWSGKPAIPTVTLVPVADSEAQAKALQSGEIDYAWGLDMASMRTLSANKDIVIPEPSLESATVKELVLNTRVAPFNDPEVRQAAKLTLDRDKMVKTLIGEEAGEVGNDMSGKGYVTYPEDLAQTTADKDKAREIFARKGVTSFNIIASDIVPGQTAAAELMVQEFAEVGVTVTVETLDAQTFFAQMEKVYQAPAFTFYWINRLPISNLQSQVSAESPYNVSGYSSPEISAALQTAMTSTDAKIQEENVQKVLKDQHDNGGDLIWGYQKQLSANRAGLNGVVNTQSVPLLANATFTPAK